MAEQMESFLKRMMSVVEKGQADTASQLYSSESNVLIKIQQGYDYIFRDIFSYGWGVVA